MSQILGHRRILIVAIVAAALLAAAAVDRLVVAGSSGPSNGPAAGITLSPDSGSSGSSSTSSAHTGTFAPASTGAAAGAAEPAGAAASSSALLSDLAASEHRFLVRTGSMSLLVARGDVPQAAARVVAFTTGYGGYVLDSQVSAASGRSNAYATVTVRVPANAYDAAIARFGTLGYVQDVQTSATDVTQQSVDLSARLAQARSVDRRLLGFLARATDVTQALAVQTRIEATQVKVEELSGELKALREQVTYGTLAVSIGERSRPGGHAHRHGFPAALSTSWHDLVGGFEAIVIGLGAVIPYAVLLGIVALAAWYGARVATRLRHRPGAEREAS